MPVVSWRVDEESLEFFSRYCDRNGLTRMEGFRHMVDAFRRIQESENAQEELPMNTETIHLWSGGEKKDLAAHLHRCFAPYGGELRREGRCYLGNDRFVLYILYRGRLSRDESRVVKMAGSCVRQLEQLAQSTGRRALIAVLARPDEDAPYYGLVPLEAVPRVVVETGSRNAGYPFFRRVNGESLKHKISEEDSLFVHIRGTDDRTALTAACGKPGERPDWAEDFFRG